MTGSMPHLSASLRLGMSSIGSSSFFHSWPQSSLCQMTSYWSELEVSEAVIFSTYTPYEFGIFVIFTPCLAPHFSIIASEASWMGLGW